MGEGSDLRALASPYYFFVSTPSEEGVWVEGDKMVCCQIILTAAALMEGLTMPKGKPNFCKCET